ncbi:unnamed protein product [Bemisia tabaci]|uniref:Uncharacterized protein n=1 Tax=Bemisia tabaci TaxID=7038 RepID=A0A9P0AIP4_BEMTA|nr:unnamed protein product [Bemisia tabaci]
MKSSKSPSFHLLPQELWTSRYTNLANATARGALQSQERQSYCIFSRSPELIVAEKCILLSVEININRTMDALLTSFEDAWTLAPENKKPLLTQEHRKKMAGTPIRPWTPQLFSISESSSPVSSSDVQFASDDPRNPKNKNITPGPSAPSTLSAHLPPATPTPSASMPKPDTVKPSSGPTPPAVQCTTPPCKNSNTPSALIPKSQVVKTFSTSTPPAVQTPAAHCAKPPSAKPTTPSVVVPKSPAVKTNSDSTTRAVQCARKSNTPSAVMPKSPAVKINSNSTIPPVQCAKKSNTPRAVMPKSQAVKSTSNSTTPAAQCAKSPCAKSTPSSKQSSALQPKPWKSRA